LHRKFIGNKLPFPQWAATASAKSLSSKDIQLHDSGATKDSVLRDGFTR
jgi:hypothetical protein